MSFLAWIFFGLLAGFIASRIVNSRGAGVVADIILGVVGAVVGGLLFNLVGAVGVTGFNIWSLFVAVVGAVILLAAYHALAGRRSA
ncbi:MAG: GlsB/YeaQ/YmgE family stress response membrane protein [Myxococcales bacterium]|nr:GlsB/YeaQ/YmgE family stress response membrane protein [Myxococcales bacterium]